MARAGPAGFKLADLARELGVAPATLLQRLGDKQTLIERTFARDNERFILWLESLPADIGAGVVVQIYSEATKLFGETSSLAVHLLWLREDIRDPALNRLARQRFALFRTEIVKRLPPMRISTGKTARPLDAQFHGAVTQWALEPSGRLGDFVTDSLTDGFHLCGSQVTPSSKRTEPTKPTECRHPDKLPGKQPVRFRPAFAPRNGRLTEASSNSIHFRGALMGEREP
jgi:AcrR family transcriptional regulator